MGNPTPAGQEPDLDVYLGLARAHGELTDTRQWITDLEDMLRVAWGLMTPEQRAAFRQDSEILAITEASGSDTSA